MAFIWGYQKQRGANSQGEIQKFLYVVIIESISFPLEAVSCKGTLDWKYWYLTLCGGFWGK